jgi:hypothetical protein
MPCEAMALSQVHKIDGGKPLRTIYRTLYVYLFLADHEEPINQSLHFACCRWSILNLEHPRCVLMLSLPHFLMAHMHQKYRWWS